MMMKNSKPVVLCILDGWGERIAAPDNAITTANTPNYDQMRTDSPGATLETSGLAVGLPDGQMGNSEVGHMNIGGGRVVLQDLPRIDQAIENGTLAPLAPLQDMIAKLKRSGGTCHLMGLLSPGGVHSHQDQMAALCKIMAAENIPVAVHGFLDGRDVPPKSALDYINRFERDIAALDRVSIATVSGRYYAMDRDKRWDRVKRAHDCLVDAGELNATSAQAAVEQGYADNITDEFILPTAIGDYDGMKDGDGLLMANFRADRAREILFTLVDKNFDGFERTRCVDFAAQIGMVQYSVALDEFLGALFPSDILLDTLGDVVSRAGRTQLRIAETEKYAHVTFFFNGGSEDVYDGESRILIKSPDVATYDLQPEMSAPELTDRLVDAIQGGEFDLIVVNFANPDMVGHTGIMDAAIKAVETIDTSLGRLRDALKNVGGTMLVTADHGNIEMMLSAEKTAPHTAHTTNLVPFLLVNGHQGQKLESGALCDVAPTILKLMGLEKPAAMTGKSLLINGGVA